MILNNIIDFKATVQTYSVCAIADINFILAKITIIPSISSIKRMHLCDVIGSFKEGVTSLAEYTAVINPANDISNFAKHFHQSVDALKDLVKDVNDTLKGIKDDTGAFRTIPRNISCSLWFLQQRCKEVVDKSYFYIDDKCCIKTENYNYPQRLEDFIYIASAQRCEVRFFNQKAKIWLFKKLKERGIQVEEKSNEFMPLMVTTPFVV